MNTKLPKITPTAQADKALSEMEIAALGFLVNRGGSVLVTAIPDKTEPGLFGEKMPGMPVFKKLDKRGLVVLTEEEPMEDGFQFTPMAELTDTGKAAWLAATGYVMAAR